MSTTHIPSEEVVRWRSHAGGRLIATFQAHRQDSIQMLVIFGARSDDRALHTPLAMITHRDPEVAGDELMASAIVMWNLPTGTTDQGVHEVMIAGQWWRLVIVTSAPVSRKLTDDLYSILQDDVDRNFPDELAYGTAA